ncbi:NAD(P)-binding protein [Calocera cornea HHB12733]|uniref:NAD(P)-binding protein n=1 Tax=Calocera cornea HHB12733 TaxID=1353952 RepID=A0A165E957_9BASI|nr:NAD(P)-binding protein [Calocera cornea HHB12733]
MSSTSTVYLISGANRGIGLALVTQLAARENTIVFAGARNPSSAKDLQVLESKYSGKVHLIKLTSPHEADNKAAVAQVKKIAGRLDVVIANAGLSNSFVPSDQVTLDSMREHFEVNVLGPLVLFQATWPLLKAGSSPKFVVISSALGSIEVGTTFPIPVLPYGTTKAAVDWLAAKLWFEYPSLISFPLHPGAVATDMAAAGRAALPEGMDFPMIQTDESATGILKVVDAAKRDEAGPKLMAWDGSVIPW